MVLALVGTLVLAELATPRLPYLLVLFGWAIAGAVQLAGPGLGALALTHALPFTTVFGARRGWERSGSPPAFRCLYRSHSSSRSRRS